MCNWGIQYHAPVQCIERIVRVGSCAACCGSVAEHWWFKPEVSWVRLTATAGLYTSIFASNHPNSFISNMRQDALSIILAMFMIRDQFEEEDLSRDADCYLVN